MMEHFMDEFCRRCTVDSSRSIAILSSEFSPLQLTLELPVRLPPLDTAYWFPNKQLGVKAVVSCSEGISTVAKRRHREWLNFPTRGCWSDSHTYPLYFPSRIFFPPVAVICSGRRLFIIWFTTDFRYTYLHCFSSHFPIFSFLLFLLPFYFLFISANLFIVSEWKMNIHLFSRHNNVVSLISLIKFLVIFAALYLFIFLRPNAELYKRIHLA